MQRSRILVSMTVLLLFLLPVGCASTHANTPSGKAELTIPKGSAEAYRDALVGMMIDKGYSTLDVTPYKASFEKEGGFSGDLAVGSGSRRRATFDFAPIGDEYRVVGKLELLDGKGSVQASRTGQDILDLMEAAKRVSVSSSAPDSATVR